MIYGYIFHFCKLVLFSRCFSRDIEKSHLIFKHQILAISG